MISFFILNKHYSVNPFLNAIFFTLQNCCKQWQRQILMRRSRYSLTAISLFFTKLSFSHFIHNLNYLCPSNFLSHWKRHQNNLFCFLLQQLSFNEEQYSQAIILWIIRFWTSLFPHRKNVISGHSTKCWSDPINSKMIQRWYILEISPTAISSNCRQNWVVKSTRKMKGG